MRGLKGKVALVTGAAGGMGRQICKRLVEEGCSVAMLDIDAQGLESFAAELGKFGKVCHIAVDISDYSGVCRAVAAVEETLGPVNILVNNAGWDKFSNFLDTDEALRQKVVAINLNGPINMYCILPCRGTSRRPCRRGDQKYSFQLDYKIIGKELILSIG